MANKNKNLLTFKQDDKFYYNRANRLIDDLEFSRGIKLLYNAIKLKPKNIEYRIELSRVLIDIGYYGKSIDEINKIIIIEEKITPECFYLLGVNYYEIGEYVKALNMFERYLAEDAEGEHSELVYYYLDNIEYLTVTSWQDYSIFPSNIYSTKSSITNIDETKMSDDVEIWTREQNIKALMAYSKKEYDEAKKICDNVLKKQPHNSYIKCTLALSLYKCGEEESAKNLAKDIVNSVQHDQELMSRVSYVLCTLKMDKLVVDVLQKLQNYMPYNEKISHYLAIGYFNCGEYENAKKIWADCNEIHSDNYMYHWYLDNANENYKDRLDYVEHLPREAIKDNIKYLEKVIGENDDLKDAKCWKDKKFRRIVLDSLEKSNEDVQASLLRIIYKCAEGECEDIFRKLLLCDYIDEENKNKILTYLHHLKAKEPYIMMTDFQLVDVAVNVINIDNKSKDDFLKILSYAIDKICTDESQKKQVTQVWSEIAVKFIVEGKKIRNIILWAAAFYCVALGNIDNNVEKIVADNHNLLLSSLKKIIKEIYKKGGKK